MHGHIFVGGTFDRLHNGHKAVLRAAINNGKRVTIGLTSDAYAAAHKGKTQSFQTRKQALTAWLGNLRAAIIRIDDPYEPAASDPSLDAIIVTRDNRQTGEEINVRRKKHGLSPLTLVVVPMVAAQDTRLVSSSRIRNGEIDSAGNLILPDNLRPELKKPLGKIVSAPVNKPGMIISCGDMATKTLLDAGIIPTIAIVDYRVERVPYFNDRARLLQTYRRTQRVQSGPGFIANKALGVIARWAKRPSPLLLEIIGEEDLLTIPAIVYAPAGSTLYYGQPGKGLVEVPVTKEKKKAAKGLLGKFLT